MINPLRNFHKTSPWFISQMTIFFYKKIAPLRWKRASVCLSWTKAIPALSWISAVALALSFNSFNFCLSLIEVLKELSYQRILHTALAWISRVCFSAPRPARQEIVVLAPEALASCLIIIMMAIMIVMTMDDYHNDDLVDRCLSQEPLFLLPSKI